MGTVGDAFDNAMAESFFASLECELIDRKTFKILNLIILDFTPINNHQHHACHVPSGGKKDCANWFETKISRKESAMAEKAKDRSYKEANEKMVGEPVFLFPLRLPPVARYDTNPLISRLCKSIAPSVRCPDFIAENGNVVGSFGGPNPAAGRLPIDDLATSLPANLRVSFVLQQMEKLRASTSSRSTNASWADLYPIKRISIQFYIPLFYTA